MQKSKGEKYTYHHLKYLNSDLGCTIFKYIFYQYIVDNWDTINKM